ncbi:hypothetical protein PIB30_041223 [Stylosanthes scabra]|uniref:Uncharacterized protein n=1 Tax=Stylosanthes scabra TaxID=79078 RepID=A0ABU6RFG1_9FABA|nr:hypothetical protein [Stylosanthes scabra]
MAEVEAMGFDDVANIKINAEIVERELGLPSCGDEFPKYWPTDADYEALKSRWGKICLTDLKDFVVECPLKTEEERMYFREAVILLLGNTFFSPTTNSILSPERHFPLMGEEYNKQEAGNNERDDQCGEGVIEDEEVIKKWTQIEEELKSQRTMVVFEKKKLTKEQEEEIEKTLNDAADFFMDDFDGYTPKDTILTERNLTAYETRGEYVRMNLNLGLDKENFDKEKAAIRQWEQLNEIRRKLVVEIVTSKYNTHRIEVFQKSFALPQRRNYPNREKKKEVKTPFTVPNTKE